MTREADDQRSAPEGDDTGPETRDDVSAPPRRDDVSAPPRRDDVSAPPRRDEDASAADDAGLAEQLDLPLEAMLDWGTGPAKSEGVEAELEAQAAEALVAGERDEYLAALQRLQADFDNFRKRSMRQQTELLDHATEGLCVRLLPVLDALDLAIAHVRSQAEPSDSDKALEQIDALLRDTLAREGIERIDAVGVPFDPTVHDAVGTFPAEPPAPASTRAPSHGSTPRSARPARAARARTSWASPHLPVAPTARPTRPKLPRRPRRRASRRAVGRPGHASRVPDEVEGAQAGDGLRRRPRHTDMAPQRDWYTTDYYKVLGVSDKATDKELRHAYRKLAKDFHPDSRPGSEEKFKAVSAAYDVLGDPEKRKEYDEVRRLGPLSNLGGFGGSQSGGGGTFNFRIDDLSDIFGGLFGRAGRGGAHDVGKRPEAGRARSRGRAAPFVRGGRGGGRHDRQRRERDTLLDLRWVGLATWEHACGVPPLQRARSPERQPGHVLALLAVPRLPGPGDPYRRPLPGLQRHGSRAAPTPGQGQDPRRGGRRPTHPRERARGAGGEQRAGGRPLCRGPRSTAPRLRRKGRNLTLTVPITYPEAALGAAIKVPSLTEPVTLKIPAGTRQGRTFRVKGRGITSGSSTGDLLVTVDVVVPSHLTDDQRHAVEALAKTLDSSPRHHLGV